MTQHSDGADQDGAGDTDGSLSELTCLKKQYAELHRNFEMSTSMLRNEIQNPNGVTTTAMSTALFCDCKKAEVLLTLVRSKDEEYSDGVVRAGKSLTKIPAKQATAVKCCIKTETEHRPGGSEENNKKKSMQRKPSKRENLMHCDSSDDDDDV
ncbi:hypothetical protein HF521_021456 [Silurus meridionalis]|uniref:Uncharacterized protein n=1 Tax=Silurus meridionalis TaxID=175797 RepID=A0A8T0BBD3_SILME|nr:hypothetical protein HF521_021456 [Silurus meridionalis]